MTEAVFRKVMDLVVRIFIARSQDVITAAQATPGTTVASLADSLWDVALQARRQAWAAAVLFMRGQARRHGADEAWVPGIPGYSKVAVRDAIREARAGRLTPESGKRLQIILARHVESAARQTVADAVDYSPNNAELLDDPADIEKHLKDVSDKAREEITREVHREQAKRRPNQDWGEMFDELANRVDRAIDEIQSDGVARRAKIEHLPELEPVPMADRLDKRGRVIARPFAFARVVHPSRNGPCGFCVLLASRGPVYRSSTTAGIRVDRFHTSCRCTVVPVYTSRSWPGKKQWQEFERMYNEVVTDHDLHGADARRAMDRAQYAKRKEAQ